MTIAERVRVVSTGGGWLVQVVLDPTGEPVCGGFHRCESTAVLEARRARRALRQPQALAHLRRLGAVA